MTSFQRQPTRSSVSSRFLSVDLCITDKEKVKNIVEINKQNMHKIYVWQQFEVNMNLNTLVSPKTQYDL